MLRSYGQDVAVFSFANAGHVVPEGVTMFSATTPGNVENPDNLTALRACIETYEPTVVINQMSYEHVIGDVIRTSTDAPSVGCLHNTLLSVVNNLDTYAQHALPASLVPLATTKLGKAFLLRRHRTRHARDLSRILDTYDRFVMFAEPNLAELEYFVPDFDPERIALIPNSIENVAPSVPRKERRILWLGRVETRQKRADLILPLWRRLISQLPEWTLDVVGDGPEIDEIRASIAAESLPRIEVHGRQPSKPFFERSALYVMTSVFEGFPNTLVEAQSQGSVPIVFDSYPMVRSLISDGQMADSYPPMISKPSQVPCDTSASLPTTGCAWPMAPWRRRHGSRRMRSHCIGMPSSAVSSNGILDEMDA